MPLFKIYSGLGGGFGGATYQYTEEFDSEEQARKDAYQCACDIYESQEGVGCDGYNEFLEQAIEDLDKNDYEDEAEYELALEEYISELSEESRESWVDYYVKETDSIEEEE